MPADRDVAARIGAGVRKPSMNETAGRDTRCGLRRALWGIERYTRLQSRMVFNGDRPRMLVQLWRYGTSIAIWGKRLFRLV